MRYLLALACLLIAGGCAAQPPYNTAHRATSQIEVGIGTCSATAVGPHVLISASHCFDLGLRAIAVNGKQCHLVRVIHDGHDHALIVLASECPQKYRARFGHRANTGDELFVWGAPGDFHDLLRVVRVAGDAHLSKGEEAEWPVLKDGAQLLTGALGKGDSGAAVFDAQGRIVGLVSFGTMDHTYPPNLFTGMLPLTFTREQLREAGL